MSITTIKLEVHQVCEFDVYKDVARIHEDMRCCIAEGTICKLSANGESVLVAIRGVSNKAYERRKLNKDVIFLDEKVRKRLKADRNNPYSFTITDTRCCIEQLYWQLQWACNASEPALQIAARLGALSVILAILSLYLSYER